MQHFSRREFLESSLLAAGALLLRPGASHAAVGPGLETVIAPNISGEEQAGQPDIWATEVRFKPVRMIQVEMRDPETGKPGRQLVWYLAYRAVVRPDSRLPNTKSGEDRPLLVPELTFFVEDEGKSQIYPDRILPIAQAAINKREKHAYKNSVEIVAALPKVTPTTSKSITSLDGVATWTGIDPDVDFFAIYFTGFSNGYKIIEGPNGEEVVQRRTLVQKFWRPGDRFDQNEEEIKLKDEAKWIYR